MKHKFTYSNTFDAPKVETSKDYSPSWWEGLSVLILYFGKKLLWLFVAVYFFFKFFE